MERQNHWQGWWKIKPLFNKTSPELHKSVLQQNNLLNTLTGIHNQFIVIPIMIGTLHLFARILCHCSLKRTGLDHNNTSTNNCCIPIHKTNNQVISSHATFLRSKFNFIVDEENKKLSNIFWTLPKLYKHLSKARYIVKAR